MRDMSIKPFLSIQLSENDSKPKGLDDDVYNLDIKVVRVTTGVLSQPAAGHRTDDCSNVCTNWDCE